MQKQPKFTVNCRLCPRLSGFLDEIKKQYPHYHARPVLPFGDDDPALLIVGLAPGMHGANASGRPFTGDFAGILLYQTLFDFGFSNQPESVANDGLKLLNCRITNAVKCLPPQNKPIGSEILTCNAYLNNEIKTLNKNAGILALGTIAHNAVIKALGLRLKDYPFKHNLVHTLSPDLWMIDSYHCSRYNTQTKRLTPRMFQDVFKNIRSKITQ